MVSVRKIVSILIAVLAVLILAACGSSSTNAPPSETGQLSLSLTDATLRQYQAVYVTIDEVSVHIADTDVWKVVATPMRTVNLLELVNGILLDLGLTEMDPGYYTQLRLLVGSSADGTRNIFENIHPFANYVIDENDDTHQLKVPSGMQSGIKLVKGFNINAGEITELILDFDAARSVVKAGNSGQWILKPTIKVLDTRQYAIIEGTVEDLDSPGLVLPGTLVSAQNSVAAIDEADQVNSAAATVSDELGQYKLVVNPGDYNLVAFAEGYNPECTKVAAVSGVTWTGDFLMTQNVTGATVTGGVSVISDNPDQHVDISVRQSIFCYDETLVVQILSDQIAAGGTYSFTLPAGDYRVVASTIREEIQATQAVDITLNNGEIVFQDFNFD